MIKLSNLLSEVLKGIPVDILTTTPLADADETTIFQNPRNSKTLIAISSDAYHQALQSKDPDLSKFMDKDILSEIPKYEVFKRNPGIYPKIIQVTPTYVELEKLDTDRVRQDMERILPYLKKSKLTFSNLVNNFYKYILKLPEMGFPKDIIELIRLYSNLVSQTKNILSPKDLQNMNRVDDEGGVVTDLDAHEGNFGYSSNGKLKILDF